MTNNNKDPVITDTDLYQAFSLMKRKDFDGALSRINAGLKKAEAAGDQNLKGLYYSALGVLHKMQGDFKKSYKFYQQAEKALPDESSLQIISALLLIEEFNQCDTAIKKLEAVLVRDSADPAIAHHAKAAMGLAFLASGKKKQAVAILEELIAVDFIPLRSASNVDYKLVEALLKKNLASDQCHDYLKKALAFAQKNKEKIFENAIGKLLTYLPNIIPPP